MTLTWRGWRKRKSDPAERPAAVSESDQDMAVPKIPLAILREFGSTLWDPIDMMPHLPADEYDTYLLQLVSRLRGGSSDESAIQYLVTIESEAMGLGATPTARDRAAALVTAVRSYLGDFPPGHLKVR